MVNKAEFIKTVSPHAIASERKYGVPAPVIIAQAILESGWGTSELANNANAYFGVKYSSGWPLEGNPHVKGFYEKVSWEVINGKNVDVKSKFCRYDSLEESMLDHGLFLRKQRYIPALSLFEQTGDIDQYARDIQTAGYATDPEYANKLIRLMKENNLYDIRPNDEVNDEVNKRINELNAKMDRLYVVVLRLIDIMIDMNKGK